MNVQIQVEKKSVSLCVCGVNATSTASGCVSKRAQIIIIIMWRMAPTSDQIRSDHVAPWNWKSKRCVDQRRCGQRVREIPPQLFSLWVNRFTDCATSIAASQYLLCVRRLKKLRVFVCLREFKVTECWPTTRLKLTNICLPQTICVPLPCGQFRREH